MQSKRLSFIESVTNTVVGFLISIVVTVLYLGTWQTSFVLVGSLTVVSIVRGYLVRRVFNQWRDEP